MIERERHADPLDIANDRAMAELENLIAEHSYRLNQATVHYVDCCYCGTETENGAKFCCPECCADHERFEDAKARNGR